MLLFIGCIAIGTGLAVILNVSLDIYGLYRNPLGRKLPVYGDSRVAKYLLSRRYVPANFNTVLIGSSMSANWEMTAVPRLRIYNASLNGANVVEEKAIVDQALANSGIAVALLIVHPYLTRSHDFETVQLEPSLWWSSLGSDNLLTAYKDMLRDRLGRPEQSIDAAGAERFFKFPARLNPTMQHLMRPGSSFDVDPVALTAYRGLVKELRAHGIQIVFVIPPIAERLLQSKAEAFLQYDAEMTADRLPGEVVIDFTSPEFAAFRRNEANFSDGIHLYAKAAAEVVSQIGLRIGTAMAEGRLRLEAHSR